MQASEAVFSEQARWNAFVASSSHRSFLQTWAWGDVQQALGASRFRIVVEDNGKLVAVALVILRSLKMGYSWLYIPRGPIFREGLDERYTARAWLALEDKIKSLAREHNAFFVRVDPSWESFSVAGWQKASREVQPQHTLLLDLSSPEEEMLAHMHAKTRYNIRVAERKGVQVRFSSSVEDVRTFTAIAKSVTGRTGFSYHPDEYYRAIVEVLGNAGMAELAIAEIKGEAIAAHLMVYADGIATYAHGASMNEHRSVMAPALLYWETIRRAKEKGLQQYDFFGIAPEDAPKDHPWNGITRMKLGFGGTRVSYCGAYDLVLNEALYTMFTITRMAKTFLKNGLL